ncbi:MAG: hypothetical protein JO016_15285 [Actinobacteria bacterium]|nr:hypothetical protein [Actinomycetota bacterium]
MRVFKRSRPTAADHKPTWRERRAAERTAKAEAQLEQTEQKIHEIADQVRGDLKQSR